MQTPNSMIDRKALDYWITTDRVHCAFVCVHRNSPQRQSVSRVAGNARNM